MKIKETTSRNQDFSSYADMMSSELSKLPRRPKTITQCASMQDLIERQKDPEKRKAYYEYQNSPEFWEKVKAPHPESVERRISPDEFIMYEGMRQSSKNELGASDESASTQERKEKAMSAFTCSQPAKLTPQELEKLTRLTKIMELRKVPEEVEKGIWEKIKSLFKKDDPVELTYIPRITQEVLDDFQIKEKK